MKLRLLLFKDCKRRCKGCCNKDWNLDALSACQDFSPYQLIMLTGGEPMLKPEIVKQTVAEIRRQTSAPIFMYSAKTNDVQALLEVLVLVDGITLTLHTQKDVALFRKFDAARQAANISLKQLRLNIFSNVQIKTAAIHPDWIIKSGIEWIKDCPLPTDEVFMKLHTN